MNPQEPKYPEGPSGADQPTDPFKPVAYDAQGRPLYAAPPQANTPSPVHFHRAVNPAKIEITPEIKAKHEESVRRYPTLNLSEAEYVISAVRRHPIGLILPVGVTVFFVALVLSLLINYPLIVRSMGLVSPPSAETAWLIGGILIFLFSIGGYVAVWVYMNNKFFLTNESVIQEIQISLFSKHEQTVSLLNIEDASFKQQGIIQALFNYGSIRLSTEGDETTYRFNYVTDPKRQIAILNNAVEAFKSGHPISLSDT